MVGLVFSLIYNEARRIWCYRWILLATTAVVFLAAALYIFSIPKTYEAWGQIFVPKQTPLTQATEGVSLVGQGYGNPYVTQKTMLNDENLEKVVRKINPAAGAMSQQARESAIGALRGSIKIEDGGDGFLEFRYVDQDPVKAQNVTRILMDQFIVDNVSRSRTDLAAASAFLDEQIAAYEKTMLESQTKMAEFRRRHPQVAAAPIPTGDTAGELAGARVAYESARAQTGGAAPVSAPQDEAIAGLERQLASLLTQYTEQYPDVIATRRQIANLRAQRAQSLATARPAPVRADPVVSAARERLVMAQARAQASRGSGDAAPPTLSAEWAELRRKNELLATNYQDLISRREGTKMSQAVYGSNNFGKYQITRAPTVPVFPVGPNRPLYLALAAVAAIGAGVAAAYARGAATGIFVSARELEDAFQLPVIGTVSWEPAWHTQKSTRAQRALGRTKQRALPAS